MKVSYVKTIGEYDIVLNEGYVENGKASMFIRDASYNTIYDFGILDAKIAHWIFSKMKKGK